MTECNHSIGHLTDNYSDDEAYAIYVAHHEMAKSARSTLELLATGMKVRIEQLAQGGEA